MYNSYYSILDEVLAKKKIVSDEILVVEAILGEILAISNPKSLGERDFYLTKV